MRKKILLVLTLALGFSLILGGKQLKRAYAYYETLEEEKDYIIVTKNHSTFNKINDKYEDIKTETEEATETLESNNVMVSEIKLREANKLVKDENVIAVEENYKVKATGNISVDEVATISKITEEWNRTMVNAKYGDNMNVANKVKVAILDSGIEYSDRLNIVSRKSFLPGDIAGNEVFEDITGHGTSVAGVLAAKKVIGSTLKGMNTNVDIYSAKILDEENKAPISRVIAGIYWAIENDVDIISISFGTKEYSKALELAVKDATDKGILIVAAAGNDNTTVVEYPAAFDEVLAVGGVDSKGNASSQSSIGKEIDVYAPGEKVVSLGSFDGEVVVTGTSIAVPHVVGVASVLWQKDKTKSAEFIKNLIIDSANRSNDKLNKGIVDLKYALALYNTYSVNNINNKINGSSSNTNSDNKVSTGVTNEATSLGTSVINKQALSIADTDNYVTGSWGSVSHQDAVTQATADYKLNSAQIKLLKWGAIYSDRSSNLQGMTTNPYFHGYNKKKDFEETKQAYNYLAGYIYLTRCALAGTYNQDKSDLLNTTGNINEMDEKMKLINFGGTEKFEGKYLKQPVLYGYKNTQENRSLLLWGMAMHTAADVFAHSSYTEYEGETTYISHEGDLREADNAEFIPARYKAAKAVVRNVMKHYVDGTEGSVEDFVLGSEYFDGSFQIRNLSKYAAELNQLDGAQMDSIEQISRNLKY